MQLKAHTDPNKELSGSFFEAVTSHCLFYEAVFNSNGLLNFDETFDEKMVACGVDRAQYSNQLLYATFSGVRFFPNLGDLFIGPRLKDEVTTAAWQMSAEWFHQHPDLSRKASISEAGLNETINVHDRRSKTLLVGKPEKFVEEIMNKQSLLGFIPINQFHERKEATCIALGRYKEMSISLISQRFQPFVDCCRHLFRIEGDEQFHTLNMTHSGISLHFDCAGAAADGFFSGPGRSICTVRLDGPDVYIFVQEHPGYCIPHNRFPCCIYWKMKTNDLWGLVDMSRYLTNHAV